MTGGASGAPSEHLQTGPPAEVDWIGGVLA
jgi:hypothetical protein